MCYIAAFELPNEDLFGAIKEGNISLQHRDKRSVRKHSGNLWIPAAVPSNPGECSGDRGPVLQSGRSRPVQGLLIEIKLHFPLLESPNLKFLH